MAFDESMVSLVLPLGVHACHVWCVVEGSAPSGMQNPSGGVAKARGGNYSHCQRCCTGFCTRLTCDACTTPPFCISLPMSAHVGHTLPCSTGQCFKPTGLYCVHNHTSRPTQTEGL